MFGSCTIKMSSKKKVLPDEMIEKDFWNWVDLFNSRKSMNKSVHNKKIKPDKFIQKDFWDWSDRFNDFDGEFLVKIFYVRRWDSRGVKFDIRSYVIKNYYV